KSTDEPDNSRGIDTQANRNAIVELVNFVNQPMPSPLSTIQPESITNVTRPYRCTVEGCGKSYIRKNHLKYHIGTHSGVKQFTCSNCSKSFHYKQRLV